MGARPELVCFDMAGTTVIDDGQVPQAFVAALAAHGIAIGEEDIRNVRGAAKRQAILDLLPPGPDGGEGRSRARDVSRPARPALPGYGARDPGGGRRVPMAARPRRPRRDQHRLRSRYGADACRGAGWSKGVVDAIVCGDDVAQGRPRPDMILRCMKLTGVERAALVANVGDTVLDLQAGHNAKVAGTSGCSPGRTSAR